MTTCIIHVLENGVITAKRMLNAHSARMKDDHMKMPKPGYNVQDRGGQRIYRCGFLMFQDRNDVWTLIPFLSIWNCYRYQRSGLDFGLKEAYSYLCRETGQAVYIKPQTYEDAASKDISDGKKHLVP